MKTWSAGDRSVLLLLAAVVAVGLAAGFPSVEARDAIELGRSYAEWRRPPGELIVDGQRVRADEHTTWKGTYRTLEDIPLGFEVRVAGTRQPDGAVVARAIEVRENETTFFERAVEQASTALEQRWLQRGTAFDDNARGRRGAIGAISQDGHEVARVRRIVSRLAPTYTDPSTLRVYVIDNKDWNALAMGNGAIWIFSGLLNDMSDNELAIIVGHELAHYTHEHAVLQMRKQLWAQAGTLAVLLAAGAIDSTLLSLSAQWGARLGLNALVSGYGRDLEDQADRVGLRYAYEAGYDATGAPRVWERFLEKYGEGDRVTSFFFSHHSQPSARQRNLEQELRFNYAAR
jgi:Zn-dependent protease with chaperone function